MQRVNEFMFYELAQKVDVLAKIPETEYRYSAHWNDLWIARLAIHEVSVQRSLHFTAPAAEKLIAAISAVVPSEVDELLSSWEEKINIDNDIIVNFRVSAIRSAAQDFVISLRTECQLMDTYFVSKKGAYSTKDLVENAHYQIPEPGRSELPQQAKLDFDQAGKCMAFDVPTAAAFHLLRATESVIRVYYDLIIPGIKRANPKMRNWGVYIKLMRAHGGDVTTLNLLDHLRDAYRNPVTHPEENYTDERLQVLFGLCVSAVSLTLQAVRSAKLTSALLSFPAIPPPPPLIP